MKEQLLQLFRDHPQAALAISLLVNVLIALLGFLPSFFITAANLLFFGFWKGTLLSFAGEALGAVLAFLLYRRGLRRFSRQPLEAYPRLRRLREAEGREAFLLIFSLRLLPFVPSGLVTLAASLGRVSFLTFLFSSSLGKLPALLIEAWSVYQVTRFQWQGKLVLTLVALGFLAYLLFRRKSNSLS